jgi:hypothetical protein
MMPQQFMRPIPAPTYPGGNSAAPSPQTGALNWNTPPSRPSDLQYPQPSSRPTVRAQAPDETPLASAPALQRQESAFLHIPSPEELGIGAGGAASKSAFDWNAVHARLGQLNATFQSRRSTDGYFEFTCLLPTARQGQAHRIEARAASETEAVRLALDKVEEWSGKQ